MYGVVLMMAMASGAETPTLFNKGSKGCTGCTGTVVNSCTGHSCHGGRAHKMKRSKSCSGCTGYVTCHGGPVVGCYGTQTVGCPFCIGIPSAPGYVPKYVSNDRFSCMITSTCWIV